MDLTDHMVTMLDMARATGAGADAVLVLLTHDVDKGYAALADPVDGGWTIELGSLDQLQTLITIEHGWLDSEVLSQVRGFAVDGLVYEVVGGFRIQAPEPNSAIKEWRFPVAPTGEEFAL